MFCNVKCTGNNVPEKAEGRIFVCGVGYYKLCSTTIHYRCTK